MKHNQTPHRPRSLALLSTLPPTLTLHANYSHSHWPRSRRTLQLRGPVLQISKSPTSSTLLILRPTSSPRPQGPTTALLSPSHKFFFNSTHDRDRFLLAVRSAITRSTIGSHRYTVLRQIGHGASGVVYLARRKDDGKLFALKTVSKVDVFSSETHLANLVTERVALAEAASRRSPFIVRLVDAFETRSHLCFVTELGSFGDLKHVFAQLPGKRMDESTVRTLFAEILLGLEDTHRMGYLYRDLKLGNLLLNRHGHVRVADFGLAKRLEVEVCASSVSSESGSEADVADEEEPFRLVGRAMSFVGTRRYMSPEHLQGGYGAPADVWALGVTLYLMLMGHYPVGRGVSPRDSPAMFDAIVNEEISFPEWLSVEAVDLLKGLLQRNTLERFDIAEIKSHPWMKGVDWIGLRADAAEDLPREDVLNVLEENGVKTIEDGAKTEDDLLAEEPVFSSLSGSGSGASRRRKSVPLTELVAFGYLNI